MNLITLTTDFGLKDPFVGMMKGVIYRINGTVTIVDISHEIGSQDILEGAFVISQSYRFFPEDTVHMVVVDPGVGSSRRPILVKASGHYFVGPDNGVLSLVIGEDSGSRMIEITSEQYFLKGISATFHGRDIFAPVAAWLSKGVEPDHFGRIIYDYTRLEIPAIEKGPDYVKGSVIYIDRFGNIITNIPYANLDPFTQGTISISSFLIRIRGIEITGMNKYYAEVRAGELGTIIDSFGLLEIYAYTDSAAKILNAKKGDIVEVSFTPST